MGKIQEIAGEIEAERERLITEACKVISNDQNLTEDFVLKTALKMAEAQNITIEEAIKKRFVFDVQRIKDLEDMAEIKACRGNFKTTYPSATAGRPVKKKETQN